MVRDASTETPPIPSRPVAAPIRSNIDPSPTSFAVVTSLSAGATPTHITFTVGLDEWGSAKRISPPTGGTPRTPHARCVLGWAGGGRARPPPAVRPPGEFAPPADPGNHAREQDPVA